MASGQSFTGTERARAAAAACWSIAYTARCDLTMLDEAGPLPDSALHLLATRRNDYVHLEY